MSRKEIKEVVKPSKMIESKSTGFSQGIDLSNDKNVRFVSTVRELILYRDERNFIQFKNNSYISNKPEEIEFIKSSAAFGHSVWEGFFPPHIQKARDERAKERSPYRGAHEPISFNE